MHRYFDSVSSAASAIDKGAPVVAAQIRVLKSDGTPAQLFADNGVTFLAQPVLSNGLGEYYFYVADGTYTLKIADPNGDNVVTLPDVQIFDIVALSAATAAAANINYPAVAASVAPLLPPLLGPSFKGDPGGNTMAVGTFMSISTSGTFAPVAGTNVIQTSGYSVDGVGPAVYVKSATNPGLPGAGSFQGAGGQWWRMVPVAGGVDIEAFGGACDCPYASFSYTGAETYPMPTAGTYTDNLQPLYDALRCVNVGTLLPGRNELGSLIPIRFMQNIDTAQCYGFSGTIIPQYSCYLLGTNSGGDSIKTGTTFRFPPNTRGMRLNHRVGQPAGYAPMSVGNSRIEGIWFQGGGGTDRTAHGISHRVSLFLRNCVFDSFAGNNTDNVGYTGLPTTDERFGLTSGSSYENVTCRAAGNWNSWVEGSDVSASVFYNLHHKVSRLGGLYEGGYFGNQYVGYQNNEHGTGKLGACTYGGRHYQLSSPVTTGGTVTPGTNDLIWEDLGPGTANVYYPDWVSGGTYAMSVPTFASTVLTEITGYIENYYLRNVGGRISGTMNPGRYCLCEGADYGPGNRATVTTPFGTHLTVAASDPNYATLGPTVDVSLGLDNLNRNVIHCWETVPHGRWSTAFEGANIRFGLGTPGTGVRPANYYLGNSTTTTLGRVASADARGFNVAVNFALGIESNPSTARVHVSYSGSIPHKYFDATGTLQNRPLGEVLYNVNPTIGGALIYTAMGDGTSQPVGIVGAVRATGLTSSSTAAQIVAALQAAGLAA